MVMTTSRCPMQNAQEMKGRDKKDERICYNCNKPGHMKNKCKLPKATRTVGQNQTETNEECIHGMACFANNCKQKHPTGWTLEKARKEQLAKIGGACETCKSMFHNTAGHGKCTKCNKPGHNWRNCKMMQASTDVTYAYDDSDEWEAGEGEKR